MCISASGSTDDCVVALVSFDYSETSYETNQLTKLLEAFKGQ